MMQAVVGVDGKEVQVLEQGDLNRAVNKFLAWSFGVGIPALLGGVWIVSAYASDTRSYHTAQEVRLVRDSMAVAANRDLILKNSLTLSQIDSLRFEIRLLSESVEATNRMIRQATRR